MLMLAVFFNILAAFGCILHVDNEKSAKYPISTFLFLTWRVFQLVRKATAEPSHALVFGKLTPKMQLNPWIEVHCVLHSNVIEYKYFNPRIKFDLVFFYIYISIASRYN